VVDNHDIIKDQGPAKRILVTGSRDWDYGDLLNIMLDALQKHYVPGAVLIHGAAHGADTLAAFLWKKRVCKLIGEHEVCIESYPVSREDWKRYGRRAGPRRNRIMAESGADICLGFPLGKARGTRGCMEIASSYGIQVESLT
jgi:YspA, cpYpsA-related SLOG family